jgi:hypothetical protein
MNLVLRLLLLVVVLSLLKIVNLFKLILIWSNCGVVITIWKLTFRRKNYIFHTKTNSIRFNYYVSGVSILRTDCIKDLGVMLDSKL